MEVLTVFEMNCNKSRGECWEEHNCTFFVWSSLDAMRSEKHARD